MSMSRFPDQHNSQPLQPRTVLILIAILMALAAIVAFCESDDSVVPPPSPSTLAATSVPSHGA